MTERGLPGGPVVKNPPSIAGDAGSIPGRGTRIPHPVEQLSPRCKEDPTCPERATQPKINKYFFKNPKPQKLTLKNK